jgi:glucose/arabinose dehydrogenase/chitodextrinase
MPGGNLYRSKKIKLIALIGCFVAAMASGVLIQSEASAAATPLFKQVAAREINAGTVNSLPFNSANAAGNLIVAYVVWGNTGSVSLTDSHANAYLSARPATAWGSGNSWRAQVFYAKAIAVGSNTVTATFSNSVSGSFGILYIHEYAGIDKINPFDVSAATKGSGSAVNSGSATTTNANDLIFGAGASAGAISQVGAGFTSRSSFSGNRTEDKNVTAAGSYNATATTNGGQWVMQMVAFRADAGVDTTPPSVPANLTATAASSTQVDLGWNASTDNVGVAGYQVERCQGTGCSNFTLLATVPGLTYNNTGLSPSTSYSYRVRATDAAGNLSGYSNAASATTQGTPDTSPPSVPTGLDGTGTSISQINLSWSASTDNVAVSGYRIFRNGSQVGTSATASFHDTGLAVNTTYAYTVSAYDAAGNNSAQSPSVNASTLPDTTAPSVPTNLAAQVISGTQINLSWTASADNVGVSSYHVYRDNTLVATVTTTSFPDTGLTPGNTYSYAVSASDAATNESAKTANVLASTPAPDTQDPAASMTAPAPGSIASGTITVSATASDNVGVAGVQFILDGINLGAEDTSAPYSINWNTTTATNGTHHLSAQARDTSGRIGASSGTFTVTVANSSTPPLPVGLVAGWNFNESTGTTTADVTGNGNTATLVNSPLWTAGKYGGGLKLDRVNDYLSIANSSSINLTGNAMTFSAWVNPLGGGGDDQVLFGKFYNGSMTSPYYQYGMELRGGGTAPAFQIGTSAGVQTASMGSSLPTGQWSHLAVVFDGTKAAFYLNGNLVSSPALTATISAHNNPLYLGADIGPGQFLNGTIDDARLYNRTLTQAEVQSDMNTPLLAPSTDPSGPAVVITSPANNAQVGGIITLAADASDPSNDLAGVQFFVDGTPIGPEDTLAEYGANWDTRTFSNGAHTITARARDQAGHTTISAPITVNVINSDYFQNQELASGFDLATSMKFLPDGRMLIAELKGNIKVLSGPDYLTADPTPFLQLTNIGGDAAAVSEGIFDFALDPNFATNHYYYVFYTAANPHEDRLSRFTGNASLTGTVPGSELILYSLDVLNAEHHGGAVTIANDGTIMFTIGDHVDAAAAQNLANPRGKVHRINRDGSVPTDNPFYDGAGSNVDSIWAYGFRNPYRAYYDAPTGRLLVGDVGGNDFATAYEEIDLIARGANYGWPNCESGACGNPAYTAPIYNYAHNSRDAAVTGGFVYHANGGAHPFPSGMEGDYFFGDYAQNWIKRLTLDANGNATGTFNFEPADGTVDGPYGDIVYLIEGPDGSLYYIDLGFSDGTGTGDRKSRVHRIQYLKSNQAPIAIAQATSPASGPPPLSVTFSSAGSRDPEGLPVTYLWDFGDGTTSTQANPGHTFSTAGHYNARLAVSDGVNTTFSTPIGVTVGTPPVATITSPADGITFRAGQVINYSGDGTDAEDGSLSAGAFSWTVDFLHEGHVHPGSTATGSKTGTFTIPTTGHDFSGNTRYRITLTVTDSNGLTDTKSVIIWPQKVNLTFNTAPATGLTLYLDGIAKTAPFTYDTLIGFNHTIEARNQALGGTNYTFSSWSDGAAQSHTLVVPATDQSYTATFSASQPSNGPAAAWGFGEGTGTTSADATANNNTAALVNGLAWAAGKHGSGLNFDGTNDYLSVPNSTSTNISGNALTLSMWLSPSAVTSDRVLLGKFWNTSMTSPYYQYGIELSGGTPNLQIGTTGGVLTASMGSALPLNQWSHLAIVFSGTQAQFYLNGTLVSTKPLSASITARGNVMRVGADLDPSQFYKGLLDDVRIYNRVQTAAEVQADMNTGL